MLKFRFSLLLLVISVALIAHDALAMSPQTTLVFKDGTSKSGTIKSLNPWAITFTNNRYYAIKLLAKIITTDPSTVSELKSYYPEISYKKQAKTYTIEVADLKMLPLKGHSNRNFVHRYFILLNGMTARDEQLEFQMNLVPRFSPELVAQIAITSGTNFERDGTNFNTIALGVGQIFPFQKWSLVASVHLAEKILMPEDNSKLVTYLSISSQKVFFQKLVLSAGGRYYFSNIPVQEKTTRFSFNIGIGYNFQLAPN